MGAVPAKNIINEVEKITQKIKKGKRSHLGYNVFDPEITNVLHGKFTINELTNKGLRDLLYTESAEDKKYGIKLPV